jgi:AcrR family transcriptional regulator
MLSLSQMEAPPTAAPRGSLARRAPAGGPRPRWRRRAADRPAEILNAALELFVKQGFAATRLDDVARRAGVTKGTIYLYFDSKQSLFRGIVESVLLPALQELEREVAEFAGPTDALIRRLVRHWWAVVSQQPLAGIPKLMVSEAANFPEFARFFVERVVRRARGLFAQVIERGMARGEIRKVDPALAARVLMAPMMFTAIWRGSMAPFDSEPFDVKTFLDLHLNSWLRGMAVQAARPATDRISRRQKNETRLA